MFDPNLTFKDNSGEYFYNLVIYVLGIADPLLPRGTVDEHKE